MDLDTNVVDGILCALGQLRRYLGLVTQRQHLFNFEPVHGH